VNFFLGDSVDTEDVGHLEPFWPVLRCQSLAGLHNFEARSNSYGNRHTPGAKLQYSKIDELQPIIWKGIETWVNCRTEYELGRAGSRNGLLGIVNDDEH